MYANDDFWIMRSFHHRRLLLCTESAFIHMDKVSEVEHNAAEEFAMHLT